MSNEQDMWDLNTGEFPYLGKANGREKGVTRADDKALRRSRVEFVADSLGMESPFGWTPSSNGEAGEFLERGIRVIENYIRRVN